MADDNHESADLRALVLKDLGSTDDDARTAFDHVFGSALPTFADATTEALEIWSKFRDEIDDTDARRIAVTAIAFTVINQNIASYKLFMSGYIVASGALFRQVIEGVSLASLCSAKSLKVLDQFLDNKYSPSKAITDIVKHAKKAHVNRAALKTLSSQYNFYHKYAHLSWLTIAAGANFSLGGLPNVGAHFDPGKLAEYRKEVRNRVNFAKVLPNFVKGVARNVATW